jgi:hypothetical protein
MAMEAFSVSAQKHIEKALGAMKLQSIDDAPPAVRERLEHEASEIALRDVFGHGFQRDRHGNPIEQGIGSPGRETEQHFAALLKFEGPEAERAAREKANRLKGTAK